MANFYKIDYVEEFARMGYKPNMRMSGTPLLFEPFRVSFRAPRHDPTSSKISSTLPGVRFS